MHRTPVITYTILTPGEARAARLRRFAARAMYGVVLSAAIIAPSPLVTAGANTTVSTRPAVEVSATQQRVL